MQRLLDEGAEHENISGSGPNLGGCLAPGTLVHLTDGTARPVEELGAEDVILAFQASDNHQPVHAVVTAVRQFSARELVVIDLPDESITVTPNQGLYVADRQRFVTAANLSSGDLVRSSSGEDVPVVGVSRTPAGPLATVLMPEAAPGVGLHLGRGGLMSLKMAPIEVDGDGE